MDTHFEFVFSPFDHISSDCYVLSKFWNDVCIIFKWDGEVMLMMLIIIPALNMMGQILVF